jgi:hypothetical protein
MMTPTKLNRGYLQPSNFAEGTTMHFLPLDSEEKRITELIPKDAFSSYINNLWIGLSFLISLRGN